MRVGPFLGDYISLMSGLILFGIMKYKLGLFLTLLLGPESLISKCF